MADKNQNTTRFPNILINALVVLCIVLLIVQIASDTLNELQANRSSEGYGVYMEPGDSGKLVQPTPTATPGLGFPTPTYDDITHGE